VSDRHGPESVPLTGNIPLSNTTVTAVYFYGDGCTHCETVQPLLDELRQKYPNLHLELLEVYHNTTNQQTFVEMNRQYNTGNSGIPVIFIGDQALVGETEIKDHFEERILAEEQRTAPCTSNAPALSNLRHENCSPATSLSVPVVTVSALADSSNPCALSVLIFLLVSIAAAENRKRILLAGGLYTAAVFLFHLLLGIGFLSMISLSGLSEPFSLIGATIAFILGAITIFDVVKNTDRFTFAIADSGKGLIGRYVRTASLPAAFVLGILAGLFGFSCTGGIYIGILALMGRSLTLATGLFWLLLYNLIFILPLVIVTLLFAFGLSPERADEWKTNNRRTLRLIIGLIMIGLSAIIFLGLLG